MPQRNGSGSPNIVPYQVFRCADGALMIAAGNDKLFAALCGVLELPELVTDPRFATNGARVQHRQALIPLLQAKVERLSMAQCLKKISAASIPCGPCTTWTRCFNMSKPGHSAFCKPHPTGK